MWGDGDPLHDGDGSDGEVIQLANARPDRPGVLVGLVRKCLRGHQRGESRSIRIARMPLTRSAYLA
jgi:hypothetical protein